MLHDKGSEASRRRDFAVICGDRAPVSGLDATIAACDALNRAGVSDATIAACDALNRAGIGGDDGLLLGDALVELASDAGVLPTGVVLDVRRILIGYYPGAVSRSPALVAFWDMGPECAIRACHLGDGDDEVIGHVPWARSHVDGEECGALGGDLTVVGRARLLYLRESILGCDGRPWIRADLDSDMATTSVAPKYLR